MVNTTPKQSEESHSPCIPQEAETGILEFRSLHFFRDFSSSKTFKLPWDPFGRISGLFLPCFLRHGTALLVVSCSIDEAKVDSNVHWKRKKERIFGRKECGVACGEFMWKQGEMLSNSFQN
eukprot:Gb_24429 [translate_table: standard]